MASRRESILAALKTKLDTIAGVGVYRSRLTAISRAESPAIVLRPLSEQIVKRNNDLSERELTLVVEIVARGQTADQVADAHAVAAHAKVMEDQNLGGLCLALHELGTEWQMEDADLDAALVSMRYLVKYRASATTLN